MPPIYLFEDSHFDRLYPLTFTRPACLLRCGATTLLDRVAAVLESLKHPHPLAGLLVRHGLADVLRQHTPLPVNPGVTTKDGVLLLNARWLMLPGESPLPDGRLPDPDSAGLVANAIAWAHLSAETAANLNFSLLHEARTLESILPSLQRSTARVTLINRPWDLLEHQRAALLADWPRFGPAQHGEILPGAHLLEPENIHIGANAKIYPTAVLDASAGPIIVEAHTEVHPHTVITGPCHIGPHCVIRAHADIRPECSFGPHCRVGGEIIGSIFLGYANKQHHGFVGQSLIGAWANLGAGTTTSNLKNTYGVIRVPLNGTDENTNRQFMGAIIADHAKLGIGTYLSTGSVVGFASHVTVSRPPKFVPSFAWVVPDRYDGSTKIARIEFEKTLALARTVMDRRHIAFTDADRDLFIHVAGEYALRESFDWDLHMPLTGPPADP